MQRPTIAIILLLVMATAIGCTGNAIHAQGIAYLDPPADQRDGPTAEALLTLERVEVSGRQAEFIGEVSYDGTVLPFHIDGTFHQSVLGHPNDKVAGAEDRTGNFLVLHIGLRENPPGWILASSDNDSTLETPMLSIYLMPKDERQMIFVDVPVSEPPLSDVLLPIMVLDLEHGEFHSDYWQPLMGHLLRQATPE